MRKSISDFRAILLAISSFAIWVFVDTTMKLAGEAEIPSYEIIAVIGFFGAALMVAYALPRGEIRTLWPHSPRNQIIRGSLSLFSGVLNAIALKHLPLTLFYVTVFTAPIMIALLAAFFLKERLTLGKALAVITGFIGVMIAINPFQDFAQGEWIGYGAATASTLCYATSTVWLRRMSQNETTACTTFFTALVEAVGCGLIMLFWHTEPLTFYVTAVLFAGGALCLIGNFAFFAAIKYTAAANVAQFHYTQIIIGAILGYLIWQDIPALNLYAGAAIIIASGLYIANHARRADKAQVAPL